MTVWFHVEPDFTSASIWFHAEHPSSTSVAGVLQMTELRIGKTRTCTSELMPNQFGHSLAPQSDFTSGYPDVSFTLRITRQTSGSTIGPTVRQKTHQRVRPTVSQESQSHTKEFRVTTDSRFTLRVTPKSSESVWQIGRLEKSWLSRASVTHQRA